MDKPLFQRYLVLWIVARFRAVANEKLLLDRIVEVTPLLQSPDIDLEVDP